MFAYFNGIDEIVETWPKGSPREFLNKNEKYYQKGSFDKNNKFIPDGEKVINKNYDKSIDNKLIDEKRKKAYIDECDSLFFEAHASDNIDLTNWKKKRKEIKKRFPKV